MLRAKTTVSMWGNSQALRIPVEMTRQLGILANDEVVLEVRENILTVSKPETPREGTIEYLFKDESPPKSIKKSTYRNSQNTKNTVPLRHVPRKRKNQAA